MGPGVSYTRIVVAAQGFSPYLNGTESAVPRPTIRPAEQRPIRRLKRSPSGRSAFGTFATSRNSLASCRLRESPSSVRTAPARQTCSRPFTTSGFFALSGALPTRSWCGWVRTPSVLRPRSRVRWRNGGSRLLIRGAHGGSASRWTGSRWSVCRKPSARWGSSRSASRTSSW